MLNKELKKIKGSVLAIGIDGKKQDILDKNKEVIECYVLSSQINKENSLLKSKTRTKIIRIKKIKKVFRKKKFDYIIINYEELKKYLTTFIKDSISLNKNIIYFYNLDDDDIELLQHRYKRYHSIITIKDNFIIIDNNNAKTNYFKNWYYLICDRVYDLVDFIGNMFVN